jgi:shikimate dehydrogenase
MAWAISPTCTPTAWIPLPAPRSSWLQDAGAAITFCNRTPERAAALAAEFPPAATLPWEQREAALKNFALLVNTTALGMQHQPPLPMSLHAAGPTLTVSDIVYVPLETQLLQEARQRGLKPVEGLGMLLHQAVPGFEAWFGVRPEVDAELYRIVAADLL